MLLPVTEIPLDYRDNFLVSALFMRLLKRGALRYYMSAEKVGTKSWMMLANYRRGLLVVKAAVDMTLPREISLAPAISAGLVGW